MEMGFCLYGNDIDDTTSPMSAGLGWVTKFTKDFVDADLLKAQKVEGTPRKLRGLVMDDRGIPRQGYNVMDASDNVVGQVTSGTMSPSLGHGIGMAYLDRAVSALSTDLFVQIRSKRVACHVVKFPFLTS
jgi:aminomethyltransferase